MTDIKLIALDLDGTLLDSQKRLSDTNREALRYAAEEKGVIIVPATGRFYKGIPEEVRELPFIRYAITINGARIYDAGTDSSVSDITIPLDTAIEIMKFLDDFPIIYDCYIDDWGWMTESMYNAAGDFAANEQVLKMFRNLRTPVPELKAYAAQRGRDVQKVQLTLKTEDKELRERLFAELGERFPDTAISSAIFNNIEINNCEARKDKAIYRLAEYLGFNPRQTAAIGDGLNDVAMIKAAGVGVAMANGVPEVLEAADMITGTNDENGVAQAVFRLLGRDKI